MLLKYFGLESIAGRTAAIGLLLLSTVVQGVEVTAEFNAGIGESDNIGLSTTQEIEEVFSALGIVFDLTENSRRLTVNARSQLNYVSFADGTFDDELVGGFVGAAEVSLLDDRIIWTLRENFGQQLADPLGASSPGNRQDVNYFSTGPSFRLRSGARHFVNLDFLYSTVNFETQPNDNRRSSAGLTLGREISRSTTVSLNFDVERVEYDDSSVSPPFDRQDLFLEYEKQGSKNTVSIQVGASNVETQGNEASGEYVQLAWLRQISEFSNISISGGRRFSDQGNIFRFLQDSSQDLQAANNATVLTGPFQNDFFTVSYNLNSRRTDIQFIALISNEDYEISPLFDRDLTRVSGTIRNDLTRKLYGSVDLAFESRDFNRQVRKDDDTTLGATLGFRFSDLIRLSLRYQKFSRNSTASNSDIDEKRIYLSITYVPAWSR